MRSPAVAFVLSSFLTGCGGSIATDKGSPDDAAASPPRRFVDAGHAAPETGDAQVVRAVGDATFDANVDVQTDAVADALRAPLGLTAVPLSSCTPNEYTATVTLGGSQAFQMSLDTGSTSLGVASTMCSGCGVAPEYTPGAAATNENQPVSAQYGSGSWSGQVYQDTVSLGNGAITSVDFGAIGSQDEFFEPVMCDSKSTSVQGIIGFGPAGGELPGTNGFFDQLVATTGVANVFATELCDSAGTLWLGGYDPAFTTAPPQYTPIDESFLGQYYYAVNVVSIKVAGVTVPIASPEYTDGIVDTGTSLIIVSTEALNALANAIASTPAFETIFGTQPNPTDAGADAATDAPLDAGLAANASFFSNQGQCVRLTQTKAALDAMLPPLTLVFGSNPSIEVQALATESYLEAADGYWCSTLYAIDPSADNPLSSILGSPVLRSNIVIFDRANQRIGFAPHTACD